MNCRPGDLAVVVSAVMTPEMIGRFVVVERPARDGEVIDGVRLNLPACEELIWLVRSAVNGSSLTLRLDGGGKVQVSARPFWDRGLRPIRPNEGEDESLSWAKPQIKEPA